MEEPSNFSNRGINVFFFFLSLERNILRDDGGNGDIGYTWPVQLDKSRVLVVYYFNNENGPRYIAGTILEIKAK